MKTIRAIVGGIVMAGAIICGGMGYSYFSKHIPEYNIKLLINAAMSPNEIQNNINNQSIVKNVPIYNSEKVGQEKGDNKKYNSAIEEALKNGQINVENKLSNSLFLGNESYSGMENSNKIKIEYNRKTNIITEFDINNPKKKYTLKLVNSIVGIGIQLDKYDDGKLIGRYNFVYGQGQWLGTYTEISPVANVVNSAWVQGND